MGDLLVRGGKVVDGTGSAPVVGDVRVRGGRIVEVGPGLTPDGEKVLDATGAFVTSGFIDVHTHFDPSLWWDPGCDPMPVHGITTIVTGNCSLSLAPLRAEHREDLSGAFSFIEDMPEEAFRVGIPWSWETWAEYRDATNATGLAVNAAALVGHSLLRLYVMGDEAWERPASPAERAEIANLLGDCLANGGVGLSTSFADVDARGRPVPSRLADDDELMALTEVLGAMNRPVLEFVPSVRDHAEKMEHIERVHRVGSPHGVRGCWTQIVSGGERTEELLAQARRTQAEGPGVFPQYSPRPLDISINLDRTIAFSFIPAWHKLVAADRMAKREMLADDWWREKARTHWDRAKMSFIPTRENSRHRIRLTEVSDEHREWEGRGFDELVAARGGHPSDVLADWYLEHDLDAGVTVKGMSNDDPDAAAELLADPTVIVGGSDAGAHLTMFCGVGDITLLLTRHVRDRGDLGLPEAIRRVTSESAAFFGIDDRGRIAPGFAGDLVVFDLDELTYPAEEMVADVPGGGRRMRRAAGGYRATCVEGVVTQFDGEPTGARPGGMIDPDRLPSQ